MTSDWSNREWFRNLCRVMLAVFLAQSLDPARAGLNHLWIEWQFGPAPAYATDPLLACTPDADCNDPFIVAEAAALQNDPTQIFAFVGDQIGYESYTGSLRGARGTLWSKAGNALDQASLMIALLRASGIPAQYVRGTLAESDAKTLILSMFPNPLRVVGCLDPGTILADPANDPQLLSETEDHFWVQFDAGSGFQDADPTVPGASIGQAFASVSDTFAEVPDSLRHKVELQLKRELTTPLAGLLTGTSGADVGVVLDQTFNTVELVGRSLSIGNFVNSSGIGAIASSVTNNYSPYVLVNERDGNVTADPLFRGTDYQETLTNFPFGSQILTGVFLDMILHAPDGSTQTVEKTIVDRIGYATRHNGGGAMINVPADAAPALNDADIVTLEIDTSKQPLDPLLSQADVLQQEESQLAALEAQIVDPNSVSPQMEQAIVTLVRSVVLDSTSLVGGILGFTSDSLVGDFSDVALTRGYLDAPRVVAISDRNDPGPPPQELFSIDILRDAPRAEPYPIQAQLAAPAFRLGQGLIDSIAEGLITQADPTSGPNPNSSIGIFSQALAQPGAQLLTIAADTVWQLSLLPFSDEAKARMTASVGAGDTVLVPNITVSVNGSDRIAWIEIDATDHSIAVSDDGQHADMEEYPGLGTSQGFKNIILQRQAMFTQAAQGAGTNATNGAQNARTLVDGLCNAYTVIDKTLFIGEVPGVGPAQAGWIAKSACRKDPQVGQVLFGTQTPFPGFESLGVGGTGVAIAALNDPFFTIPVGGADVPTVFRIAFKNLEPTSDTFSLDLSNLPGGFSASQSLPSLTLPAGKTGEISVCLRPTSGVPAPSTPVSFDVSATSNSNSAVTGSATENLNVPQIDAVTLSAQPVLVSTVSGVPAPTVLTIDNVGNASENISLGAAASPHLALSSLSPVALGFGQSTTETLNVTPDANVPLNSELGVTVTATFAAMRSQTVSIPVHVVVPGADAIASAGVAAGQLGKPDLQNRLNDLSTALTNLVQDPTHPVFKSQALAALTSLITQLDNDPILFTFAAFFTDAFNALSAAMTAGDVQAAVTMLGTALTDLSTAAGDLIAHGFELSLQPNVQPGQPTVPASFQVVLRNVGNQSTTYDLSVSGLPNDVDGMFTQSSVTLAPGDSTVIPGPNVFLNVTDNSTTMLAPFTFDVTATPESAAEIARSVPGSLTTRSEFVSVVSVTPNPAFTAAGGMVDVSAEILNAVNQERQAQASFVVKDPMNNTVLTSTAVPVQLTLLTSLLNVDLGNLDTTGFADGEYTITVTLTDSMSNPIPGATGTGTLLIGSPVTASMSISPTTLPPGDGTVTDTLQIDTSATFDSALTLHGQISIPGGGQGVGLSGTTAFVCAASNIDIIDATDPTNLSISKTFGSGGFGCTVDGSELVTYGSGIPCTVAIYSVADLTNPQLLGSTAVSYGFPGQLLISGSDAFIASREFDFDTFSHAVLAQHGTLVAVNLSPATSPSFAGVLFNNIGAPYGGNNNEWPGAIANSTTALIGSTTSTGSNVQSGTGEVLVVDISDPTNMHLATSMQLPTGALAIPGTLQILGVALQGTTALAVGSSGNWNSGQVDLGLTGHIVLTTLDVTDPRNPSIIAQQSLTRASRGLGAPAISLGNGLFAFSNLGAISGDHPEVVVVNARDPHNLSVSEVQVPADVSEMAAGNGELYTASSSGLLIYDIGATPTLPVTAKVEIPNNTGVSVVSNSFNIAPTEILSGANADTLEWDFAFSSGATSKTITWQTDVTGLQPGEARPVANGAAVDFSFLSTPGEITLPPRSVSSEQILALDPASRTVAPGAPASYMLTVQNPTGTPVTYNLSVQGVPADWVHLQSSVMVAAMGQAMVPLTLTSGLFEPTGEEDFTVTASVLGTNGSVQGALILQGSPTLPAADAQAHGVVAQFLPAQVTAGEGMPAILTLRVTNTGSASEDFTLVLNAPGGFGTTLGQMQVTVPPGADNFVDLPITVTPPINTTPNTYVLMATATSVTKPDVSSSASANVNVVSSGVSVSISPSSGPPGTPFQMMVTNTGQVADTFNLALSGPAALVSTLGSTSLHLNAGQSQSVGITVGAISFALPGSLLLVGTATSQANTAVHASASAQVTVARTEGLKASFDPNSVTLPAPGPASFTLNVQNIGNEEDAYEAQITATSGPVTASLVGLDGQPTQMIQTFRLPGLNSGAIILSATLNPSSPDTARSAQASQTAGTMGTVTVMVKSLSDPSRSTTSTATIMLKAPANTEARAPLLSSSSLVLLVLLLLLLGIAEERRRKKAKV